MAHYVKKIPFWRGERQRNEWFRAVELDIAKFRPVHERLTASFRSRAKKAIFVAAIIQPFFGWLPSVVDTDVAQKRPVHQRLAASFITPPTRKINVANITQPDFSWVSLFNTESPVTSASRLVDINSIMDITSIV